MVSESGNYGSMPHAVIIEMLLFESEWRGYLSLDGRSYSFNDSHALYLLYSLYPALSHHG